MKRTLAAALFAAVLTITPHQAAADVPVIDITSILKQAEQIQNQIQQIQNQVQQIQLMKQNLQTLPQTVWTNVQGNLQQLQSIIGSDKSIVLTSQNAASQFSSMYQGGYDPRRYISNTNKWYDATYNASSTVIATANAVLGQQNDDLAALAQQEAQINNPAGETVVLQAAATIAAQQVEQLHKLLTLTAQENSAESQFRTQYASQQQRKDNSSEGMSLWLRGKKPVAQPTADPR